MDNDDGIDEFILDEGLEGEEDTLALTESEDDDAPDNQQHERPRTPSQDPDFQSQVQVAVLPKLPGHASLPEPRPKNVETEESICSICFEPWTNSGLHRLISIKCGHLFGESCIVKWMGHKSQSGKAKCPECNTEFKRRDIRRIWSKSVVAVDTAERDTALERAKTEQDRSTRLEVELRQSRMAFDMLKEEATRLQKEHDKQKARKLRYKAQVRQLRLAHPSDLIQRQYAYKAINKIPLSNKATEATQCFSYRMDEQVLVYSQQRNINVHGIARITMADKAYDPLSFMSIHLQPIRDVQCYNGDSFSNKSLVLTASADKTLKVSSLSTRQVVVSYELEAQVWSCCWSTTDPYALFCSVKGQQTSILTLDLRKANAPVATFSQPSLLGHSQIHSMAHIGPHNSEKSEALLCGNLQGPFVYNWGNDYGPRQSQEGILGTSQSFADDKSMNMGSGSSSSSANHAPLHFPGASCFSVSFDHDSRQWMASYKFLSRGYTQHNRGILSVDRGSDYYCLASQHQVQGGPPAQGMAKTNMFSLQDGSVQMAAGSEGEAYIWREGADPSRNSKGGSSNLERLTLAMPTTYGVHSCQAKAPVKDVKYVSVGHDEYVAALTERELQLFKWSELEPEPLLLDESEESDDDTAGDRPKGKESVAGSIVHKRRFESEDGPYPLP
ncbi:RING finger and WD repeat domain-containing protein 3 [Gryganskiella cystojenkinii]|nr:RING finger and WD repeat domain-containing protein 3 [Gryganskiella cystojenkinii]